ncbi:C-type lectin-like [Boleophthalmus pectinirostris]|uniref:C-type lectin-like n=1 Tax=Boleophthalmus pectinirostris TaxID=150288 RepID=UPI000A1C48DF|nr:C-type lectin-like [Boleophthalmus pectinirostris]
MSIKYSNIDECKLNFDDKMDSLRQRSGRRFEVNTKAIWILLGVLGVTLLIVIVVLLSHNYVAVSSLNSQQQKSDEKDTFMAMVLQGFKNLTQNNKGQNMAGFCSSGWIEVNRECYYISPKGTSKTWTASKRDCESRGGRLVIIKSRSKLELLSLFHLNIWVGLSDREKEGTWKWLDGTGLEGSAFWLEGEPNDDNQNEDCAHLNVIAAEIGFNDNNCESVFPYICETLE